MKRIDLLLEKYFATSQKKVYGEEIEYFVNPTKKEISDMKKNNDDSFRFIADAKDKKVYIFSPKKFHKDAWGMDLKSGNRKIYEDASLFAGTMEGSDIYNYGLDDRYYDAEVVEEWLTHPDMFDFASRWVNISKWISINKRTLEDYLE